MSTCDISPEAQVLQCLGIIMLGAKGMEFHLQDEDVNWRNVELIVWGPRPFVPWLSF